MANAAILRKQHLPAGRLSRFGRSAAHGHHRTQQAYESGGAAHPACAQFVGESVEPAHPRTAPTARAKCVQSRRRALGLACPDARKSERERGARVDRAASVGFKLRRDRALVDDGIAPIVERDPLG